MIPALREDHTPKGKTARTVGITAMGGWVVPG